MAFYTIYIHHKLFIDYVCMNTPGIRTQQTGVTQQIQSCIGRHYECGTIESIETTDHGHIKFHGLLCPDKHNFYIGAFNMPSNTALNGCVALVCYVRISSVMRVEQICISYDHFQQYGDPMV